MFVSGTRARGGAFKILSGLGMPGFVSRLTASTCVKATKLVSECVWAFACVVCRSRILQLLRDGRTARLLCMIIEASGRFRGYVARRIVGCNGRESTTIACVWGVGAASCAQRRLSVSALVTLRVAAADRVVRWHRGGAKGFRRRDGRGCVVPAAHRQGLARGVVQRQRRIRDGKCGPNGRRMGAGKARSALDSEHAAIK